ncbi:MAG TPA: hypothetical protein VGH76_21070 [Actinomycetospora sp.]|uniref:hypothetical protein n=1 Tax=Actinomycetospora sp. TaxID=1872135 RepID=UPI002F3FB57D
MDHDGPDPLTRLRAAAAAVSDLDADLDGDDAPGDPAEHDRGAGFDAAAHADRFTELHDALVTVLADVDRG